MGGAFVGRRREVELVLPMLTGASPHALVIGGTAGVGKTRLVQEVVATLAGGERPIEWIACTASNRAIPFGAVARLLVTPGRGVDPRQLAAVTVAVTVAKLAERKPLLVVDDGHLLDDLGALLVQQVVLGGAAQVIITVRTGEPCPAALEVLWRDRHATRVDLLPLSAAESELLLRSLLGAEVSADAADAVYDATRGNPLFVEQVVDDGLQSGAFQRHGQAWTWTRAGLADGAHVRESVRRRLEGVRLPVRELVLYVALAEPLAVALAVGLAEGVDLDDALRTGLVSLERSGHRRELRLGHPLFGEVVVALEDDNAVARRRVELADRVRSTGSRRQGDTLREASLRLQAHDLRDPGLFERAADRAIFLGDLDSAERFASAAVEAAASPTGLVLLGEVLVLLADDPDRAERVLRQALTVAEEDHALVGIAYALRMLGHHLGEDRGADVVDAVRDRLQDPVWKAILDGHLAQELVLQGRTREGGERAEAILREWGHDPRVRLRLLTSVGPSRALAGRTAEALELLGSSLPDALAHQGELPMAPMWVVSNQLIVLFLAGRFDDAARVLDLVSGVVPLAGPTGGFRNLFAGRLALARGHATEAAELLGVASAEYTRSDAGGFLRWVLSLEAEAAALCGELDRARLCVTKAEQATSTTLTYDGEAARARAWVLAAEGRRTAAVSALVATAAAQREEGQHLLAAVTLHDALRLGGGATVLTALEHAVEGVDGDLGAAIRHHARAARQGDASASEEAAERFETMGQLLHAAEIYAHTALAFDRERLPARAARAGRRARELLAACGHPNSPAFPGAPERARLTRREQEVVALAAAGHTNREIADRLYVSLRTAEGHLHRAMVKLGVTSREELASLER